ncbi:MAG: primosomal protein N' [bacterium]
MAIFADIVPLTKIPRGREGAFTYSVPENLATSIKIGQRVLIPFQNKKITGVVKKVHNQKPNFKGELKEVFQIGDKELFIDDKHWQLITWMSEYYHESENKLIRMMTPPLLKNKNDKIVSQDDSLNKINNLDLTKTQKEVFNRINSGKELTYLISGVTGSGKTEVYFHLITEALKKEKQVIVLTPEFTQLPQLVQRIHQRFGEDTVALINSKITPKERRKIFSSISSGNKNIIVGPRSALFAPVKKLGLIIVDEEHDYSYKQFDMMPRYHVRHVARVLSNLYEAKLILGSATPSLEEIYSAEVGSSVRLELPNRIVKTEKGVTEKIQQHKIDIIDLQEERKKQNFSIFSDKLESSISKTLQKNEQVLLFVNRRGLVPVVFCENCGQREICHNCNLPLTYHEQNNKLVCHHCLQQKDFLGYCSKCESPKLSHRGYGTEKVVRAAEKLWPDKNILRIDSDSNLSKKDYQQNYNKILKKEVDIIIGTQMITKGMDIESISLIGVLLAESFLNFPDFRSSERMWQTISQVIGRSGRLQAGGQAIIQTYDLKLPALQAIVEHNNEKFFQQELKIRKDLNYPPYSRLLRFIYENSDLTKVKKEAQIFVQSIQEIIKNTDSEMLGPAPCFLAKLRNKYRYHIIVKLSKKDKISKQKILSVINNDWIIDVDPEDTL